LGQLADTGYNFKRKTLLQIKKDMGYAGGMYGLLGLLKRKGLTYKKTKFIVPLDLTERIAALGATDDMTPMEIFKKIKIDVQNPSQQLKKRGIVYKKRTRRTT
jgi:hypothetical protein